MAIGKIKRNLIYYSNKTHFIFYKSVSNWVLPDYLIKLTNKTTHIINTLLNAFKLKLQLTLLHFSLAIR